MANVRTAWHTCVSDDAAKTELKDEDWCSGKMHWAKENDKWDSLCTSDSIKTGCPCMCNHMSQMGSWMHEHEHVHGQWRGAHHNRTWAGRVAHKGLKTSFSTTSTKVSSPPVAPSQQSISGGVSDLATSLVGGTSGVLLLVAAALVVTQRRRAAGLQARLDYEMNDARNLAIPVEGANVVGMSQAQADKAAREQPINLGM
jgi:hypothetical protein